MWLKLKPWVTGAFIAGIVAFCLYLVLPIQKNIKLGLDLQGGVRVLMQLNTTPEIPKITPEIQSETEQVYRDRIDKIGVAEPQITSVGTDRILVELPNVKDPDVAIQTLKEVAKLDFKIVPSAVEQRAETDKKYAADPNGAYKDSGPIVYAGADLKSAASAPSQSGGRRISGSSSACSSTNAIFRPRRSRA
jgi:SecD/SecF fusion protein